MRRVLSPDEAAAWRRVARREMRRSRRYLLSLLEDLDPVRLDWTPARPGAGSARWHAGRAALAERELLAMVATGLETDSPTRDLPFSRQSLLEPGPGLPPMDEVLGSLRSVRRLALALLDGLRAEEARDVFREIVDSEYAHAAAIARRRHELGLAPVTEPRGELVEVDTDGELAPRFHLVGWDPPRRAAARRALGDVVSIAEHRSIRAARLLATGHRLVGAGDVREALRCFERSAALEPTADALTFQGWMHALLGDVERAEDLCRRAIELDPEFGNPYNDIGTLCMRRQDVSAAIQWFERAKRARRCESRHFPYLNLGRLYLSLGLAEKALEEFEGALVFEPGNEEALTAVEHLRLHLRA